MAIDDQSLPELVKEIRTIVTELGKDLPASSRPTTTEYLGCALDALGIRNQRGSSALGTILSGYNKLSNGLSDIRNQEGSVGHGKDGFIDAISDRHARVYLLSADTIIALLLQAYDGVEPSILKTCESHSRFSHHNERIDAATQIEAKVDEDGVVELSFRAGTLEDGFDIRVPASELLYYLDRQAYVDVLDALRGIATQPEEEKTPETEEATPEPEPTAKSAETPVGHKEPLTRKLQPVTVIRENTRNRSRRFTILSFTPFWAANPSMQRKSRILPIHCLTVWKIWQLLIGASALQPMPKCVFS